MEHYFSARPTSELRIKKIQDHIRGETFEFFTASGIFSKDRIDKGTMLLAESFEIKKEDSKVLDIGCGIGILGIVCAKLFPKTDVLMTDLNERALKMARMNVKLHKIQNIKIIASNLYEKIDGTFDVILTNPPQTAGKEICFKIIEEAKKHLNKGSTLQLVARHNKGGRSLEKKMEEIFGNVDYLDKGSGYRVYVSKNN